MHPLFVADKPGSVKKTCVRCGLLLPRVEFSRDRSKHDGLNVYCRVCSNRYGQILREARRGVALETARRNANDAAGVLRYEMRKRNAYVGENFSLDEIYERDNGICGICASLVDRKDASIDHIIPLSRGGKHSRRNVQLAHRTCNSRKGTYIDTTA